MHYQVEVLSLKRSGATFVVIEGNVDAPLADWLTKRSQDGYNLVSMKWLDPDGKDARFAEHAVCVVLAKA